MKMKSKLKRFSKYRMKRSAQLCCMYFRKRNSLVLTYCMEKRKVFL